MLRFVSRMLCNLEGVFLVLYAGAQLQWFIPFPKLSLHSSADL